MGAATLRNVRDALTRGERVSACCLSGDDDFRKEEALHELLDAAVDAPLRAFNLDVLRGSEVSAEQLGSLLQTPPMMAARRAVVVRDVLALRKEVRNILDEYLVAPAGDTLLIMTLPAGATPDRALANHSLVVEIESLAATDVSAWIAARVRILGGAGIEPTAAALLLSVVGADSAQLANELDKLVSYAAPHRIDDEAVRVIVGVRTSETLSDFLDLVAVRDVPGALRLIEPVLGQPKTTLVSIVMALTAQTLALEWGRHARDGGLPAHQLEREFYALLKETGAFPMRPWGEAVKCWSRALRHWDAESLRRALSALRAADQSAKDTRMSSDEQLLATLVCTMCTRSSRDRVVRAA
jgi:DNA polymerase-3 subunit delta